MSAHGDMLKALLSKKSGTLANKQALKEQSPTALGGKGIKNTTATAKPMKKSGARGS